MMELAEFKQWFDDLDNRYHPGPKPLKMDYTNPPVTPSTTGELRRSDYDNAMCFYLTRYDKYREKEASKIAEFQKKKHKSGFIFK